MRIESLNVVTLTGYDVREAKKRAKRASKSIGGLSNASKLPTCTRDGVGIKSTTGSSYSTSAYDCITGGKLANIPGSVCFKCYARKGRQNFPANQEAYRKRSDLYRTLGAEAWTAYMIDAILPNTDFRYFDSGDLADYAMLEACVTIAERRPDVAFWLPTKEYGFVARLKASGRKVPANLCIRVSAPMIDSLVTKYEHSSACYRNLADVPKNAHVCPCSLGERSTCDGTGSQDPCRACWQVPLVVYIEH